MKILNLFWFLLPLLSFSFADAADGGGDGGNGDSSQTPENNNADGGGAGESGGVQLSQKDLDKMFADRAKQARESERRKLLEELGLENVDAAKSALKKAKELEESQLSELEKAQKEAEKARELAEKARQEADAAIATANEQLMRAAVLNQATNAGFNDPNDAWLYITRDKITVKDDGSYDGLEAEIKRISEEKPYLLKAAVDQQPPPNGTPPRNRRPASQPPAQPPEQQQVHVNF